MKENRNSKQWKVTERKTREKEKKWRKEYNEKVKKENEEKLENN